MAKVKRNEEKENGTASQKMGVLNNYAGMTVSLNQKVAAYFGVGRNDKTGQMKVWLNESTWYTVLPDNLTVEESETIKIALDNGTLFPGRKLITRFTKGKGVKERYRALMKDAFSLKTKAPFIQLFKKKSDEGWTALEVFTYCRNEENKARARKEWLDFLKEGIETFRGPEILVKDYDDDEYTVKVDLNAQEVVADSRKDTSIIPVGKSMVSQASEEALNKFLGE